MRVAAALAVLACGCGRIAFDERGDAQSVDVGPATDAGLQLCLDDNASSLTGWSTLQGGLVLDPFGGPDGSSALSATDVADNLSLIHI